jgi:hypothetical protein
MVPCFSLIHSMLLPLAVKAASLPLNISDAATIPGFIPHAVAVAYNRSLFTIVWSCVATLFACAWVAVHPDISGLDDDAIDRFFHRVRLLVWVLISPEAVLVWAWRQHRGAQALRYMFNFPDGEGMISFTLISSSKNLTSIHPSIFGTLELSACSLSSNGRLCYLYRQE